MDNGTKKLVEEESLEMPGDTKQWLSKLLEAPIMQAEFWNNLLSCKIAKKVLNVQHITWILGPLSFKKQIHDGVDVNGNGWDDGKDGWGCDSGKGGDDDLGEVLSGKPPD